jgi:hypothetical protein
VPQERHPVTPDGRYFAVRGRLWRRSNPSLDPERRAGLVRDLMAARSAMGRARRAGDRDEGVRAKAAVDTAKRALGERGAPWWTDGAPDWNRHLARNTPYADWWAATGQILPRQGDGDREAVEGEDRLNL